MSDLEPLQKLNLTSGNIAENWRQFKIEYEKFEISHGLHQKSDKVRVSSFLDAAGNEARNMFLTFPMTSAERDHYISVVKAFDTFCATKNNFMLERFVFYNRNQIEEESFSTFLADIKRLIKACEFSRADFDLMLSNRIIFGIKDKKLQQKLINMGKLSSEQVINHCKMTEISNQHLKGVADIQLNEKLLKIPENLEAVKKQGIGNISTVLTMKEIKAKMMDRLGLDTIYTQRPKSRDYLLQFEPKRVDLPPRYMNDSFTSAIIPLTKDSTLRDSYITSTESIRFGRLMEDMDLFAVWVCHKHLYIPKLDSEVHLPYTFVTILVDEIKFTNIIPSIHNDIRLSGHVSWVGTSSMEIIVWLETVQPDSALKKITKSLFVMGARNATNTKAAPVNPLIASNIKEQFLLENANERQKRRKTDRDTNLLKVLPTQEEQKLMHDNFLLTQSDTTIFSGGHILPSNCCWMDNTKIVDIDIAFPENRNAQNQVFGGFLMRKALENSIISASLYAGSIPRIKYISDIIFHKPVEVTTILRTTTYVTYTEERNIQLMCITETRTQETDFSVTNVFHFTYESDVSIPKILPKTYQEAIWNLVGRREFLRNINI